MKHNELVSLALECGATKATVLDTESIVLSESFRDICAANQCGVYGKCWMCPPDVGDIKELMARVRRYKNALIFQTVTPLEDSFDFENMAKAGQGINELCFTMRRRLADMLGDDWLILGAGGCRACRRCSKLDGLPCRKPDEALMSLESCGFDVYNTVKDTQLKYTNGQNTVTFFGALLFN